MAEERVALVTGGASGIGQATARRLAADGMAVAVLDYDGEAAEQEAKHLLEGSARAVAVGCDVSAWEEVQSAVARVVEQLGGVHVLINCAGVLTRGSLLDGDVAGWERTLAVNLTGSYLTMKAAAPHMIRAGWGRIVNFASIAGVTRVGAGIPAYAASKAGVIALTRDTTRELGAHGITVNAVAPGVVQTPMVAGNDVWDAAMAGATPIGRTATAEEFAGIIAFLASDAAAYISGTVVTADGGLTSGIPIPGLPNG